jgi:hypothetical protein
MHRFKTGFRNKNKGKAPKDDSALQPVNEKGKQTQGTAMVSTSSRIDFIYESE